MNYELDAVMVLSVFLVVVCIRHFNIVLRLLHVYFVTMVTIGIW